MNNIVKAIQTAFRQMHTGVDVHVNGTKTLMIACPIMISADNAGFLRHNAHRGCRMCFVTKDNYGHLDEPAERRFHFDTVYHWHEGEDLTGREHYDHFHSKRDAFTGPPCNAARSRT